MRPADDLVFNLLIALDALFYQNLMDRGSWIPKRVLMEIAKGARTKMVSKNCSKRARSAKKPRKGAQTSVPTREEVDIAMDNQR